MCLCVLSLRQSVSGLQHVEFVVHPHPVIHLDADVLPTCSRFHWFQVKANLFAGQDECTRRGACHQYLVAYMQVHVLYQELRHAYLREVLHAFSHIDFLLCGLAAIHLTPFAQLLPLVVTIPKASVKHGAEFLVPHILPLIGEITVKLGCCGKNAFE